jgi:nucleoid DNA-binding protein
MVGEAVGKRWDKSSYWRGLGRIMGRSQKELAAVLGEEFNLTWREGLRLLRRLVELVGEDVVESGRCDLRGLGVLASFERPERWVTHPKTGERIKIPKKVGVRFRVSKKLRDRLN